jgi:hypothetical protein
VEGDNVAQAKGCTGLGPAQKVRFATWMQLFWHFQQR